MSAVQWGSDWWVPATTIILPLMRRLVAQQLANFEFLVYFFHDRAPKY